MAPLNFSNDAWLQAVVCVGFLSTAVYTFGVMTGAIPSTWQDAVKTLPASVAGPPALIPANSIVLGLNYLAFAVLGAGCLLWPFVSTLFSKPSKREEDGARETPASEQDVEAAQAAETKTNVAARKPKRPKLFYLTHMKTFLTFVVVNHHILCALNSGDGAEGIETKADTSSVLYKLSMFIQSADQKYFMSAFFLVSGYFCPKSLDRKGFRDYVLDKLVRLGGPYLIYYIALGPLLFMWTSTYAGGDVTYFQSVSTQGPSWFILWLLNYSIIYAIIAQVMPVIRFKMPNPVLLTVGGFAFGVLYHTLVGMTALGVTLPNMFWNMNKWTYGISIYIPFFAAGIIGGRNGWLDGIENMSRWCKWSLRVIVGCLLILQLIDAFDVINWSSPHGLGWLQDGLEFGVYPVGMTLMQMQLFHEFLNVNNTFWAAIGGAAYTVYIIHPWFLSVWLLCFVEILKLLHVPIVFTQDVIQATTIFQTTDDDSATSALSAGAPANLKECVLWSALICMFVFTQMTVWPAAYFVRKLPVLNKML